MCNNIWERAEGETFWKTWVFYIESSNMGTVLSSGSSGDRCMMSRQVFNNSSAMYYAMHML